MTRDIKQILLYKLFVCMYYVSLLTVQNIKLFCLLFIISKLLLPCVLLVSCLLIKFNLLYIFAQ